jgi:hypothetical protein
MVPVSLVDLNSDIYFLQINDAEEVSEAFELYSVKNVTMLNAFVVHNDTEDLMNSILIKSTRRQNFAQVPIYGIKQVKFDRNILIRSDVYINSIKVC